MSPPDSHSAILASVPTASLDPAVSKLRSVGTVVRPSAASVSAFGRPVTLSPWARWKRLSARLVCGPKAPSALMPSAFWICFVVGFGAAWVG